MTRRTGRPRAMRPAGIPDDPIHLETPVTQPETAPPPERDEDAYIDWHYEQYGCAPTTGQGPAPQYGDAA